MGRGEESVQKGVSPADMALLPSVQGWPLAGVWELGFQESSLRSLTTWLAASTQFAQTVWLTVSTGHLLLFRECGVWHVPT